MIRLLLLLTLIDISMAADVPPVERPFRFLVVDGVGKPADGVPVYWSSEIEDGKNEHGGRRYKQVERKSINSGNGGVVEIPRHRFSNLSVAIDDQGLKQSATWMLDSVTATQLFSWDVYRLNNPLVHAIGPPTPGYDAVFKVLSKVGIAKLIRYNTRHKQVPCDGTPTPLRVLGGPSAQVKNPDEADVVITIKRPDQEIFSKESGLLGIAKPLRVPWILEGKTLRFAHFASDTDLSADCRPRTWVQRLEVEPSNSDHATSQGRQALRLWALIPGDPPLVIPLTCRLSLSFDSRALEKAVYSVNFEVIIPQGPHARFHHDLLSLAHYQELAPEISGEAIAQLMGPIRTTALTSTFPADLTTAPALRYDTTPNPQGEASNSRSSPVLLPSDKP